MARVKKIWTAEELKTRVCRNFHTGAWIARSNGTLVCQECQRDATATFRATKGMTPNRRTNNVERLRAEVAKLEVALEIARKKLQLLEEVEKLQEKLRDLN